MVGFAGKTEIETRFERSTVRFVVASAPLKMAVMPLTPGDCPMANPLLLVMKGGKEDHEARLVTSCVEPSLNVAVAVNCC